MNTSLNTSSKKKLRSKSLRVGLVALAGYAYFSSDVNSSTPEEDIKRNLSNIDFDKSTHTIAAVVNTAKVCSTFSRHHFILSFCFTKSFFMHTVWNGRYAKLSCTII